MLLALHRRDIMYLGTIALLLCIPSVQPMPHFDDKRAENVRCRYADIKLRPNDRNMSMQHISQHCWAQHFAFDMLDVLGSSLKMVKFEPTIPNMSHHGGQTRATCGANIVRYVVLTCCNRLAGALLLFTPL